jgi:hypothetical protein
LSHISKGVDQNGILAGKDRFFHGFSLPLERDLQRVHLNGRFQNRIFQDRLSVDLRAAFFSPLCVRRTETANNGRRHHAASVTDFSSFDRSAGLCLPDGSYRRSR